MPGQLSKLYGTIKRKPAHAADGLTDAQASAAGNVQKDTSIGHDLLHLGKDSLTLAHALKDLSSGEPMDDRKLLLENGVSMLQRLPPNSGLSHAISDGFMKMLWNDLPHPAGTLIGPQYRFRTADGSDNNPHWPEMGKAGLPYSRSVPPVTPKSPNLPDPELVFDQLLRRREFREHPSGLNRLFFSFATIVIHNIIATNREKPWINDTSSYVDLAPLYGNNQQEQHSIRTFVNGHIHPDAIASPRIMMMPPGVVALMIVFSRNHDHLAERLLEVNEGGKYQHDLSKLTDDQKKAQDEEIFQLARNINIAVFAKAVLGEYVAAILNTPRADSEWTLGLGKEIKSFGTRVERGTGNSVSCEFAVLYHWHAALSAADDKWACDVLTGDHPGKTIDDLTMEDWKSTMGKRGQQFRSQPPKEWVFGDYKRDPKTGRFNSKEIAELIKDCIDEPANAFGARGTPAALKIVDIMGQLQARGVFNVCTMNEFRLYLNLKPFETFAEWNPDPEIAAAAEKLYVHIDQLELYPGLLAEEAKPAMPGSGVCPGHTIGRGILDDAVALIRGDRFLTYDFNSSTLTQWGMSQLAPTPGSYGGILGTLLFRSLPGSFSFNSTYVHLPFYTPKAVRSILHGNKKLQLYDTDRTPSGIPLHGVHSYDAIKRIFEDRDTFRVLYEKNIKQVTGHAFMICYDDKTRHDPASIRVYKAFFEPSFETDVRAFFKRRVAEQIEQRKLAFSNSSRRQIDIVRDVCNVVPIEWLADKVAIPIKSEKNPHGLMSVAELRLILTALFVHTSFPMIDSAGWTLRDVGTQAGKTLCNLFETRLKTSAGLTEKVLDKFSKNTSYEVSDVAHRFYDKLMESKVPPAQLAADIVGSIIPVAGNCTQQSALLIDLFLSPGYEYAKERLIELSSRDDDEANKEMEGWMLEGMRHAGVVLGLPRLAATDVTVQDGDRTVEIKAGERLIIGLANAHKDPVAFPNPEKLDPTRPRDKYMLLGSGLHYCFGARLVAPSICTILKSVFALKNVRRAPGRAGHFTRVKEDIAGSTAWLYLDHNARETPIPASMRLEYDE